MKASNIKRSGGSLTYRGVSFPGFNKPRASTNPKKKKMVLAKKGEDVKVVHFGDSSMSDFTKHKNPKRRANFRSRHNCAAKKDKSTAGYWACKDLW
jgi:hypothetical protein